VSSTLQRKLSAILSADVVGYSGLMEVDEAGTLARLKENRRTIFDPCVARHGGRIVKLIGDGALVEFASVVAAVECAVALQSAMANATDQSIRYRIGVNLGDVIIEGDDIYGEGVNVAARLQALAPPGGVALSRVVRDQIEGKVAVSFQDLGEHSVKNIQRPVHVFALLPPQPNRSQVQQSDRGDRISICVLPFANMSGDSEQEYFSDGISEDIITDLSKVSALWVTARNTAFTFKGKHVDVPQVARQLKVNHVLEGSVRKSGNRVRITAQLIDSSGGHIWAERYDRNLDDIFALQDEIAEAIVKALKIKLLPEEKKAIERRGTSDPEAYKLILMVRQIANSGNTGRPQMEASVRLCRKAVEIDPNYADAWAHLATSQGGLRMWWGDKIGGLEAAERAIALDPNLAAAHAAMAMALSYETRLDEGVREAEIAYRLDPESPESNKAMAMCLYGTRRYVEAIPYWEKMITIVEADYQSAGMLAVCYRAKSDVTAARRVSELAIARAEKVVAAEPNNGNAMGFIVTSLAELSEMERAKTWAERALLLDPDNVNMRYNIGCAFVALKDIEFALDLLEPVLAQSNLLEWAKADTDLDAIRDDPRFRSMIAAAEKRIAQSKSEGKS
jgi:adenylate cyclase